MHYLVYSLFAQVYGGGAYSSTTYQSGTTTQTSSGGLLTDTGFDILVAVTVACVIVFVALLVRFWKRPKAAPQA